MFRKCLLFAGLLIAVCALVYAAAASLDGKTFEGKTGEKGKTEAHDDSLMFADGKFHSSACDQYGFTPVAYKASQKNGVTTFTAEASSEKEGKINWKGTIKGDDCDATLVWKKAGQKDVEYWFKGSVKK
ncbi:MAG: hypothetical protein C5B54_07420 [Acidobacteria bacterium]|nr:MAG: hypothetical protein C5B54_07420 [Acidobacteriota bacterium]